ncbi:ABC transporter ATP-binding protein [Phytoactinopolyspora mesophila]|uniref:ABC-type quaternary amine transporter n=1 Tax=Phytoactinopolyspora mesophila TaxID=2650750 RepID=A0A7K3M3X0_9ACTN|nr:ABC transporter ATP-binding protein [Phytoactinopolyspora mesophila]NDL57945.1 ATP-binding cassette domain-containing protein [Phytoactinopolyspora mesophila]
MIHLDRVSKTYPGPGAPAVDELSLEVHAGEIVVLLGPSGCGKTTTMRMINRLIEPTSGRIFFDGEDVTNVNADQLRRRIGYVIQQVGLIPHLTVAANIGMVPRALGWDKKRIQARVTELLDLLGLDPDVYRRRYPKQLSGGEQQRIGVARALAADPPVMLMDEPFGALDPMIRDRLQEEFLALQEKIQKTVVFVTHDIEEAIKLGDRIAIFGKGGKIAQFDTPARLLSHPADEFVASFIGSGGSVRLLGLQPVTDLPLESIDIVESSAVSVPDAGGASRALWVEDGRPMRWTRGSRGDALAVVRQSQSQFDALDAMLGAHDDMAVVVSDDGRVLGGLSLNTVLRHTAGNGREASESARADHERTP